VCVCVFVEEMEVCMRAWGCACVFVWAGRGVRACVGVCVRICVFASANVSAYLCVCVCQCARACVCMCVCQRCVCVCVCVCVIELVHNISVRVIMHFSENIEFWKCVCVCVYVCKCDFLSFSLFLSFFLFPPSKSK
jgi:hypothetical protein